MKSLPDWLRSLWNAENEMRRAAQYGLFLQKDRAATHLAEARRHLREAMGTPAEPQPQIDRTDRPTKTANQLPKEGEF